MKLRDPTQPGHLEGAYLAENILPTPDVDFMICLSIYKNSKGFQDLFLYEACIRDLLGSAVDFGRIKILPKGTAWARDNWITNSKWNDERDFMIHNWKTTQLKTFIWRPVPYGISLIASSTSEWYNPLAGPIVLRLCTRRNTTWHYYEDLLATRKEIDNRLKEYSQNVDEERARATARVQEVRRRWFAQRIES
ncbi:hypothetical protein COOONC_16381 [Cooperia oncophora]